MPQSTLNPPEISAGESSLHQRSYLHWIVWSVLDLSGSCITPQYCNCDLQIRVNHSKILWGVWKHYLVIQNKPWQCCEGEEHWEYTILYVNSCMLADVNASAIFVEFKCQEVVKLISWTWVRVAWWSGRAFGLHVKVPEGSSWNFFTFSRLLEFFKPLLDFVPFRVQVSDIRNKIMSLFTHPIADSNLYAFISVFQRMGWLSVNLQYCKTLGLVRYFLKEINF